MSELFKTILADCPWQELGGGKIKRGCDKHYSTLKTENVPDVIKNCGHWNVAENAHLYLWATNNFLEDALWVMKELDFRYITNIVWLKEKMGIGQYFRGQHELLLFGVRGKGKDGSVCSDLKNIPSGYLVPHEKENGKIVHSRKPSFFHDMIEKRSKGPYLELFARRKYSDEWSVWGNEICQL